VRPRWKRFVFSDGDVDRRYYEFAVMSELKNALRGGDVWVPGSRQFKDFDEYLLPRDDFNRRQTQGQLGLPVPTSVEVGRLRLDSALNWDLKRRRLALLDGL
jgi:hypothetical protein